MSGAAEPAAKGRPAPLLVLCRQCLEYVFEGTRCCPQCGHDARTPRVHATATAATARSRRSSGSRICRHRPRG